MKKKGTVLDGTSFGPFDDMGGNPEHVLNLAALLDECINMDASTRVKVSLSMPWEGTMTWNFTLEVLQQIWIGRQGHPFVGNDPTLCGYQAMGGLFTSDSDHFLMQYSLDPLIMRLRQQYQRQVS